MSLNITYALETLIDKTINSKLDKLNLKTEDNFASTVVMAAKGYPDNPKKGGEIKNIENVIKKYKVKIYYSGVKIKDDKTFASGGRILSVTKKGKNAISDIYKAIGEIECKDKKFRDDIGS